jgi:pyruvate/2-oxoglutarate dehydrogenase complex dihydrolipoamide dehydrogenase (E3) component
MPKTYDSIVIGAGQAGPPLAERLSQSGESVAIVERDRVGGTCVNYGCVPTKTLVASARAAHMARRGDDFGVVLDGDVGVDMKKIHARMQRISGESKDNVAKWIDGMDNVDLIRDHARFVGERTIEAGGERLEVDKVFINVGGRARIPDIDGLDEVNYLTNKDMLELDELPEHLVIVGGSYIGIEFGQMFRRFGSQVTIVEMGPKLIGREDPEVSDAVQEILEDEGIDVQLESTCFAVSRTDGGPAVRINRRQGADEIHGSHLLLATGRVPNTDNLGLEAAGVATDERGYVEVDHKLRTSAENVWALGDCNREGAFTHTSWNDFEVLAANLIDGEDRSIDHRILCYGLFMDPPLARIGMTEAQARDAGRDVLIGKRAMARVGRARERSETKGFIKILVDADSEQILGAAILGINGDEAIHSLLTLMYAEASYKVMTRAVHIHPTVSELLPTVLESLEPLE